LQSNSLKELSRIGHAATGDFSRQSSNVKPGKGTYPDNPEELEDDEEAVKKAKERLGRYG